MNKTFAIYTLGCKVNQEESAALANVFVEHGWRQLPFGEAADVCIVNTCTVTQIAEKKSRNMLRRALAANPQAYVVGTGCYVQMKPQEAAAIAGLDLLLGANEKHLLFELAAAGAEQKREPAGPLVQVCPAAQACQYQELGNANSLTNRTRAFVKIEDGCNQFCSYCIVPHVRGPVRSRPLAAVLAEVRQLVAAGYQEIVLTGIHVGAWAADGLAFADLVAAVAETPGLGRLRLGSVEPREVSPKLLQLAAENPVICPHFHIPLQAAADQILQLMGRDYDMAYYTGLVADIRRLLPAAAITTDIIAGFPGEDEVIFAAELEQVRRLAFALNQFIKAKRQSRAGLHLHNPLRSGGKGAGQTHPFHALIPLAPAIGVSIKLPNLLFLHPFGAGLRKFKHFQPSNTNITYNQYTYYKLY